MVLSPTERCECVDQATVDAMYPDWATPEDKQIAFEQGLYDLQNRERLWPACYTDKNCEPGFYFNELAC